MLKYDLTQEQWEAIKERDGKAQIAKKMFLKDKPIEEIKEFTELEDNLLEGILSELPQEIQSKYDLRQRR